MLEWVVIEVFIYLSIFIYFIYSFFVFFSFSGSYYFDLTWSDLRATFGWPALPSPWRRPRRVSRHVCEVSWHVVKSRRGFSGSREISLECRGISLGLLYNVSWALMISRCVSYSIAWVSSSTIPLTFNFPNFFPRNNFPQTHHLVLFSYSIIASLDIVFPYFLIAFAF